MGREGRPLGRAIQRLVSPEAPGSLHPLPSTVLSYEMSPAASAAGAAEDANRQARRPCLPRGRRRLCRPRGSGLRAPPRGGLRGAGVPGGGVWGSSARACCPAWVAVLCVQTRVFRAKWCVRSLPGHSPFVDVKPFISLIRVFVIMSHHSLSSLFPPPGN